jgi:glycosyltransferase involved in cell wall biosynthesis
MPIDFTVAIRTYNAEKRLPQVLDRLLTQTSTDGLRWEVLVVDNNSTDCTTAVVAEYAQRWRSDSQLRWVSEPRQGSSYARDRAMQESASNDLVGFLDDDNLPAENWVVEAYRFGQAHPHVGAYGSNIYPQFEQPPPANFNEINFLLAVHAQGEGAFQYKKTYPRHVPVGPGCVIRKQAWQEAVPDRRRLRGRDETWTVMAASAEDVEIMYYIQTSHWEVWHNGAMQVWHLMPPRRLEATYLLKVAQSSGLSAHACRIARLSPRMRPLMPLFTPVFLLVSAGKVVYYYLRYHRQFATNIAKACLFERQKGILLSAFLTPPPASFKDAQ